ncbi:hypothetical protein D6829_00700 [Candidatus Pacearchaeota archaeon]|nr:MAG: hypothetical protein D6829_00700 [Candidatus Pacearchaeota archaeon]
MEGEQRKRNIAYKLRIGDIIKGRAVSGEGRFLFVEIGDKKVVRVNIIANCVDKFVQDNEKKYASLTVDDASGQIRLKAFGDDIEVFKGIMQGDTLRIIGNLREWNGEIYVIPEILKKIDPRWLLVRKLEIQSSRKDVGDTPSVKAQIIQKIKEAEPEGGIEVDAIILDIEAKPEVINSEIKKLLEEGIIYEPRPGKLRYLG